MKKKLRITYSILFLLLFAAEVLIAVFVHDGFVRPYIGDVLVVMLVCAFLRIFIPDKIKTLPIFATLFAVFIEGLQYFDFVNLIGLSDNKIVSTVIGRTFDIKDIICYTVGGLIFFAAEWLWRKNNER
ncbi:MAG: DUF2809 domain-containing protein [Clostridia bacterium]|nr:DUF2809 domain-containing protein [Clostridia bacterium]